MRSKKNQSIIDNKEFLSTVWVQEVCEMLTEKQL